MRFTVRSSVFLGFVTVVGALSPFASPPIPAPAPSPPSTPPAPPPPSPPPPSMSYWVSFPTKIRLGEDVGVSVYIPRTSTPTTLRLDLLDYMGDPLQNGQNFTLRVTDQVQNVQFKIAETLRSSSYSMFIRAQGFGGKRFDGFERVRLQSKRLSVFIQTDKTTYQPGQTVKFRALTMQSDLLVLREPIDVVITDPGKNRIAEWRNLTSSDETGVVEGEMVTSLYPPLGAWTIKATADGVSEEQTFKMEEYELPQFEVQVKLPKYAMTTDKVVSATVTAKYTFGSPLEGSGQITVTSQYYRVTPFSLVKEFKLDRLGQAEIELSTEELRDLAFNVTYSAYSYSAALLESRRKTFSLNYKTFDFNATVFDDITDDVMSATQSMTFYERKMLLQFMPNSPSAYKPDLPLTVFVEALQPNLQDPVENPEEYTVYFQASYYRPWSIPLDGPYTTRYYWQQPPSQKQILMSTQVALNKDGVAVWEMKCLSVPEEARGIQIEAIHGEARTTKYLQKFQSLSNTYLQLRLKTKTPKLGKSVKIEVLSNKEFSNFTYQMLAKGRALVTERVTQTRASKSSVFKVKLTTAMFPATDVLAFLQTADGEVVADKLLVAIEGELPNEVSLNFQKSEVKPGQAAKLRVKASPNSTVFLLGVDKSVTLMGTGNDFTKKDVMSELLQYGSGGASYVRGTYYYTMSAYRTDDVFMSADAGIITDGTVLGENTWDIPIKYRPTTTTRPTTWISMPPFPTTPPLPPPMPTTMAPGGPEPTFPPSPEAPVPAPPPVAPSAPAPETTTVEPSREPAEPAERLRKLFPETWLWDSVKLRDKSETLKVKTPDSITTWVVTAFAVHPELGLSVATQPAELLAIKRLFVTLDLPYSAVRGEDVCITAVTFNRYSIPVNATITLVQNASAFDNTLVVREPGMQNPRRAAVIRKPVQVRIPLGLLEPESKTRTVFCINPRSLGDMPVQVYLTADKPADGLVQTIRIKPEGVERTQSYPIVIETGAGQDFSSQVNISLPEGIVPGSLRINFQLVGDVMGMVAANMEDLLKMPYGCGEQNMVHMAPNTYLIAYLRHTGRLSPPVLAKAKSFMLAGYQRQLNYQRADGSFSAFGDRDSSGSMWLTAFVVKCFVQAAALGDDVITIDPNVVNRAVEWMTRHQNTNGSFREPGRVLHRAMQGGSASGVGLSAYVIIALQEAKTSFKDHMAPTALRRLESSLSRAVNYLETSLDSADTSRDTYTLCIATYALTLTDSPRAEDARRLMKQRASSEGNLRFWSGPIEIKEKYYSWYRKTDSLSIEMTSYALLTSMLIGSLSDAVPVFRWLNSQRGPNGGFISTQDTVVGLEALSSMADLALGDDFSPIEVDVGWACSVAGTGSKAQLTVNTDNVLLLQTRELPIQGDVYPREVTVRASTLSTQRLFTLAEVVMYYNLHTSTAEQTFSAVTSVSNQTARVFTLTTCIKRNKDSNSVSMVIAEVGVPSGHVVERSRSDLGSASRVEFKDADGKVVFYYNSISTNSECSVLRIKMSQGTVANTKPSPVRVYDYYNPDDEVTTMYSLKQFGVCDLEPDYMDCPFAK